MKQVLAKGRYGVESIAQTIATGCERKDEKACMHSIIFTISPEFQKILSGICTQDLEYKGCGHCISTANSSLPLSSISA
jgi:hypothetical protein